MDAGTSTDFKIKTIRSTKIPLQKQKQQTEATTKMDTYQQNREQPPKPKLRRPKPRSSLGMRKQEPQLPSTSSLEQLDKNLQENILNPQLSLVNIAQLVNRTIFNNQKLKPHSEQLSYFMRDPLFNIQVQSYIKNHHITQPSRDLQEFLLEHLHKRLFFQQQITKCATIQSRISNMIESRLKQLQKQQKYNF